MVRFLPHLQLVDEIHVSAVWQVTSFERKSFVEIRISESRMGSGLSC